MGTQLETPLFVGDRIRARPVDLHTRLYRSHPTSPLEPKTESFGSLLSPFGKVMPYLNPEAFSERWRHGIADLAGNVDFVASENVIFREGL